MDAGLGGESVCWVWIVGGRGVAGGLTSGAAFGALAVGPSLACFAAGTRPCFVSGYLFALDLPWVQSLGT